MPMSRTSFIAGIDQYLKSVAATAKTVPESVKILSIQEIFSPDSRMKTKRLLLAISVLVLTSVILSSSQNSYIWNQTILNENLKQFGLPGCTQLELRNQTASISKVSTPTPDAQGIRFTLSEIQTPSPASGDSRSSVSSTIPLIPILGGAAGFLVLVASVFLFYRRKSIKRGHDQNRHASISQGSTGSIINTLVLDSVNQSQVIGRDREVGD
jgi:hypothetical protein